MVEFVGENTRIEPMRLRFERNLSGKIWWFDLVVPEEVWAEFYEKLPGVPPGAPKLAYLRSQPFWNLIAERNADDLSRQVSPDALPRRAERTVRDLSWLLDQHKSFEAEGHGTLFG